MSKELGGTDKHVVNIFTTPIAAEAGELFNRSEARMDPDLDPLSGYVAVNQDNLSAIIKAIAKLELEVVALKEAQQ